MKEFFFAAIRTVGPFITMIVMGALQTIVNTLYEAFWQTIFDAILEAQKTLSGGIIKKEAVIKKVMDFISTHKKLSFVQVWAVKLFIGKIIDGIIKDIKNNHGENWLDSVKEIEQKINEKTDFIDPLE